MIKPNRYLAALLLAGVFAGGAAWGTDDDRIIKADVFPKRTPLPSPTGLASRRGTPLSGEATAQPAKPSVDNNARTRAIAGLFRKYNQKLTPAQAREYAGYVLEAAGKFHEDPLLLAAIIVRESGAKPGVVSRGGDYGLMQVRWRVHQKSFPWVRDIRDPRDNILVGTQIFSECRAGLPPEKRADTRAALLRYSAGNTKMADRVLATVKELRKELKK